MSGRALVASAGLVASAVLPFASKAWRHAPVPRCERDGVEIGRILRVRIEAADGGSHVFCSVRCAADWLRHEIARPRRVLVRDEATGAEIDAAEAVWVESAVATSPRTGERLHAFALAVDARAHAAAFQGTLLAQDARPFRALP